LEIRKKAGLKKKLYLLLIVAVAALVAAIVFFALLFHKPSYYKPLNLSGSREISVYLTNKLLPELYNGLQLQEPFELVVTQSGINDIIARFKWPQEFGGVEFSSPMLCFSADTVVLMGTVSLDGTELVATVMAEPKLDAEGLLNMNVVSVKFGAVDISPLAAVLAKRICQQRYEDKNLDTQNLWNKMVISLLNGRPFEPAFKLEDKKVRVDKIKIEQKKLTIHLVPVPD
jgi:uncharacterized protein YpmS